MCEYVAFSKRESIHHPSMGTILCAERRCCLSSLLGYWVQSWTCRHSDTGYQQAGTHFSNLERMSGPTPPETPHQSAPRKPGIIAGRAGCYGNDLQMGQGGFGWSLCPPRWTAYKKRTRGPFLVGQSTTSQFLSQLVSVSQCQSDSFTRQSESSQSDDFTSQ